MPESRWQQLIEQRLDAAGDKYRYQRAITLIRRLRAAYHATDDDPRPSP